MKKIICILSLSLLFFGQATSITAAKELPQITFINKIVNTKAGPEWKLALHYPQVTIKDNTWAAAKINKYYQKWAEQTIERYQKGDPDPAIENKESKYHTSYCDAKYLSFVDEGYIYYQGAAHPLSWCVGDTFSVLTGKKLSWQELIKTEDKTAFSLAAINAKIMTSKPGKAGYLYPNFKGLKKLPKNYYLSTKGNIHFVFGQYEIAPYAVGIIDLDMEKQPK